MGGLPQWECSLLMSGHSIGNSLTGGGLPRPPDLAGQVERVYQWGGGEEKNLISTILSNDKYKHKFFTSFLCLKFLNTFLCAFCATIKPRSKDLYYKRILYEEDSLKISFRWLYYLLIQCFKVTQLQKIIYQKVKKISSWDFQRIFFNTCSVSLPNLESVALLQLLHS